MSISIKRQKTRARLLSAACDVFVERGYAEATVAEICVRAGANSASLNYHFNSKAEAYRAVYREAFEASVATFPFEIDAAASPVERLTVHIRSIIMRMNDDSQSTRFDRMRIWEDVRPTGLVDDIDEDVRIASRKHMLECLSALVGSEVSREQLLMCEASVLSLARMVLPFNRRDMTLLAHSTIDAAMVEMITHHIVDLLLGGLPRAISGGGNAKSRTPRK